MANVCEQIFNLTTAKKLMATEALLGSLHQNFEQSDPTDWHREILHQRIRIVESGEAIYEDCLRIEVHRPINIMNFLP